MGAITSPFTSYLVHCGESMHIARKSLAALALFCLTTQAVAQEPFTRADAGILGLSLTMSGTARDTLGMLVAAVALGGPAERAGIVQGNRVAELAGVSLRVDPSDIGQRGVEDQLARRLARALQGIQSGEQTSLRVISGTRERSVQVTVGAMGVASVVAGARDATPLPSAPTVNTILPQPGSAQSPAFDNGTATALTLPTVTDGLEQQRVLLRRLARNEDDEARSDSLLRVEQDLRVIVRRLRELGASGGAFVTRQKDQKQSSMGGGPTPGMPLVLPAPNIPTVQTPPNGLTSAPGMSNAGGGTEIPGIRYAPVAPELASVVGEGTEGGLFVFFADSTWAPLQSGDVILRIDGRSVEPSRLRAAVGSSEPAAFEIIRQRRRMIVTLHGR